MVYKFENLADFCNSTNNFLSNAALQDLSKNIVLAKLLEEVDYSNQMELQLCKDIHSNISRVVNDFNKDGITDEELKDYIYSYDPKELSPVYTSNEIRLWATSNMKHLDSVPNYMLYIEDTSTLTFDDIVSIAKIYFTEEYKRYMINTYYSFSNKEIQLV